jgi:hypothetical protein
VHAASQFTLPVDSNVRGQRRRNFGAYTYRHTQFRSGYTALGHSDALGSENQDGQRGRKTRNTERRVLSHYP